MAKILIVEDDKDLANLLLEHLNTMQHNVQVCAAGNVALQLCQQQEFDLIVLDLGLPEIDGLDVCKTLRMHNTRTAILMLTARNSELDRVLGLELGADDYMGKPFSLHELQARVRALLRRQANYAQTANIKEESRLLNFNELSIDATKHEVRCRGDIVNLTAREFDLLYFLASNVGHVFNREQLLNSIWGYTSSIYEHTINSNINRLRTKLELDPANPAYIHTVRGVGYKFQANNG